MKSCGALVDYRVNMQVFDFTTLEQKILECEECGWRGKGYETEKEYNLLPKVIGICCPVCGCYFGEVKRETVRKGRQTS
jgi:hypothetical protein